MNLDKYRDQVRAAADDLNDEGRRINVPGPDHAIIAASEVLRIATREIFIVFPDFTVSRYEKAPFPALGGVFLQRNPEATMRIYTNAQESSSSFLRTARFAGRDRLIVVPVAKEAIADLDLVFADDRCFWVRDCEHIWPRPSSSTSGFVGFRNLKDKTDLGIVSSVRNLLLDLEFKFARAA